MLDRTTMKIFKYIFRHPINQSIKSVAYEFNYPEYYIKESIDKLISENLIKNYKDSLSLTFKGRDYYYDYWKKRIYNFIKLFIIPILIAIISSLLTSYLISNSNNCTCNITCNEN